VSKPTTPAVSPPTLTISGSYPAGFSFNFLTVADGGVIYYLECTTNLPPLAGWNTIASTPGTGALAGLSDQNPPNRQRFYRLRIQ
jgi:hypothetical protein